MKPEWQSQNIEEAFRLYLEILSEQQDLRGYGLSLTDIDTKKLVLDGSFIWMQDENIITLDLDVNGLIVGPARMEESDKDLHNVLLMQMLLQEIQKIIIQGVTKFADVAPKTIQLIGLLFGVPEDLEIEFGGKFLTDEDYILRKVSELLVDVNLNNATALSVDQEFSTRWEIVVDLLESLQANHFNCAIGPVEADHQQTLETMQDQGINLLDEHECYVYVLGMCSMVENIWSLHKAGEVAFVEVTTVVAALRATLAVIQPFLPEAYFTRFLN